jgi:hypothetical protein
MKYLFDIGDAKEVVCDTEEPFLEGTMEHFMYGKVLPHLAPHAAIPASETTQKGNNQ